MTGAVTLEVADEIYIGDGDMPEGATIQIIMDGSDEEQTLKDDLKEYIDTNIAAAKAEMVSTVITALPKYTGGVS